MYNTYPFRGIDKALREGNELWIDLLAGGKIIAELYHSPLNSHSRPLAQGIAARLPLALEKMARAYKLGISKVPLEDPREYCQTDIQPESLDEVMHQLGKLFAIRQDGLVVLELKRGLDAATLLTVKTPTFTRAYRALDALVYSKQFKQALMPESFRSGRASA